MNDEVLQLFDRIFRGGDEPLRTACMYALAAGPPNKDVDVALERWLSELDVDVSDTTLRWYRQGRQLFLQGVLAWRSGQGVEAALQVAVPESIGNIFAGQNVVNLVRILVDDDRASTCHWLFEWGRKSRQFGDYVAEYLRGVSVPDSLHDDLAEIADAHGAGWLDLAWKNLGEERFGRALMPHPDSPMVDDVRRDKG